jgi:tRNA-dihydrouridine synthase A
MIGRAAYENPYIFASVDQLLFKEVTLVTSRREVVENMLPYIEQQLQKGLYLNRITRHMLALFKGKPGGRVWRRYLSENVHKAGSGPELVMRALQAVPDSVLDERPATNVLV